jgi:hypothetical protein
MARLVDLGWLRRDGASRAISITPIGTSELGRMLQIEALDLLDARFALFLPDDSEKPLVSTDVSAIDETPSARVG